jgi:hypothetical protein
MEFQSGEHIERALSLLGQLIDAAEDNLIRKMGYGHII